MTSVDMVQQYTLALTTPPQISNWGRPSSLPDQPSLHLTLKLDVPAKVVADALKAPHGSEARDFAVRTVRDMAAGVGLQWIFSILEKGETPDA